MKNIFAKKVIENSFKLFKTASFLSFSYLISNKFKFNNFRESIFASNINDVKDLPLPYYSRKEVGKHDSKENRIWVIYKDGVYDITDFVVNHPGGEKKIMLAAGGSLEPFWAMYSFHLDSELAKETLKKYRIGNLNKEDILKESDIPDFTFLRSQKIQSRSPHLVKLLSFPYCGECPENMLADFFYTPADLFFVRNHNTVPDPVEISDYDIEVEFENDNDNYYKTFKLKDLLENLPKKSTSSLLACAGLKRNYMEFNGQKTRGLPWKSGAIANGIWGGFLVKDLLNYVGFDLTSVKKSGQLDKLHLLCEGSDKDFQGDHYCVSVPLKDAIDVGFLANTYNGDNIPHDHGFPIRFIMPGYIGVRNVKWLKKLTISTTDAQGPYQQKDYKLIPFGESPENYDIRKLMPVQTWETNSAVMYPLDGQVLNTKKSDYINMKGWAFGTNGNEIFSIQVSLDEGKSWNDVDSMKFDYNENGKVYGWTMWNYKLKYQNLNFISQILDTDDNANLNNNNGLNKKDRVPVWVKAVDLMGNTQPIDCEKIMNARGIMNNSIHKLNVYLS